MRLSPSALRVGRKRDLQDAPGLYSEEDALDIQNPIGICELGREELRHLFRDGRIDLVPQPDGFYVARSTLLPMVLLMQSPSKAVSQGGATVSNY